MNKIDESRRITEDGQGNFVYPYASARGYVQITIPAAHGPNPTEQLLVRDFGTHVAKEVEQSLAPNPYPVASPRKSATVTFAHYVGCAEGASLMDAAGLKHMEAIAKEFEAAPDRQEYFTKILQPYLASLSPKQR